jgi:dienelactone hydrolase
LSPCRTLEKLAAAMKTFALVLLLSALPSLAANINQRQMDFLASEVARLGKRGLEEFHDPAAREKRHAEAMEMFGLSPMPERGDLRAVITGRVEDEWVTVEKLHFQSSPGLYVTANFYLPKKIEKPLPTVIYVCGHSFMITNGVSFGNKTGYGHHGAWFARNGYACLVIDTVQLGEIQGIHHGTYREGMWWWNSRGYSSAAVEAWNTIRAIDYLETRSEVDKSRIGITGRSGGGAYSWSTTALDSRIKVSAPVAGITDLRNYVIDGAVEGHCDCMFFVNTYAWDYPMLAACAAPRPLLIVNSDKDSIFPLDGVVRLNQKVANLYRLYGNTNDQGLVIGPGPHKDTQDLQIPVFRWFNKYLRGNETIIDLPATNHFTPQQLKVFDELPNDQRNATVQEWFVPKAPPGPKISSRAEWIVQKEKWMRGLKEKVFRNWPDPKWAEPVGFAHENGTYRIARASREIVGDQKTVTQMRRRYMLVGHTVDSMRVFDIIRAVNSLNENAVTIEAEGDSAVNALFASLFSDKIKTLKLKNLPASIEQGPDYLNVLRILDLREALALASERCAIEVTSSKTDPKYAREVAANLSWKNKFTEIAQ